MKKALLFFIFQLFVCTIWAQSDTIKIYQFDLKAEIAPPALRTVQEAMNEANTFGADILFVDLDTYGGRVDIADSIRTRFLRSPIPVFVLINNNAASAGALISIACDSIYMMPGSTIGAATVVDQSGQPVPDKYQSYMRQKMRATAEETNRNADMAEAMVDPDKYVPNVSDSGKVLTFTTQDAVKNGFCEGVAKTIPEAIELAGIKNYTLKKYQPSTIDNIIGWLINPAISGVLILVIVGGIYFELQSPGLGFPILASAIAAVLFFAPYYLEGLAEQWELIIFFIGIVLVAVEIFVIPGFGVAGISGIVLIVSGLTLSMIGNVGFDFEFVDSEKALEALLTVLVATIVGLGGSIILGVQLLKSSFFSRFALNAVQAKEQGFVGTDPTEHQLVGKIGTTITVMRPGGTVSVDGEYYDATALDGYLEANIEVEVVKYQTAQLIVRKK